MKVFIAGATGVVGTRVVPLLIDAGRSVTAISRSSENRAALSRLGATPVEANLFEVESLRRAIAGHEVVINLATTVPSSTTKMMMRSAWRANDRVRRDGSAAVASAAIAEGVRHLVQESFGPTYPDCGDEWIDEATPLAPAPHTESAVDAERSAMRFANEGGVGVVLRFGLFYGPDHTMEAMLDMLAKGWAPFPGDPRAFLSSIAQEDAATAVVAALAAPTGIYNIVEDDPMRRGDWAASLARAAGFDPPKALPKWLVPLSGSVLRLLARSQRLSNRRFKEVTSWVPRYARASDAWDDLLPELGVVASR